jgi:5'-methylthioadenosine nucleosidase
MSTEASVTGTQESAEKSVKHIAVIMAMEAEASHFIEQEGLKAVDHSPVHGIAKIYQGIVRGCEITLILPGKDADLGVDNVGTAPAAISAFIAVTQFQPDIIVNAGTAGGFHRYGAAIGDAWIGTQFFNHDRRIPIPGFDTYGKGGYAAFPTPNLVTKFGYKTGVVTTSNSLDHSPQDDDIMTEVGAAIKEMEAAALAWVAKVNNVPFVALKVVTDIVDGDRPSHEEFLENLAAAGKSLREHLPEVVEFMASKKFSEL